MAKMSNGSPCQSCCSTLCQHPECWRSSLQQVREAVWRRNGVESHGSSSSVKMDEIYLRKEQRVETNDGDLPTLKVIDMFGDLDSKMKGSPAGKHLRPISPHLRSGSLPSLPSTVASQERSPKPLKSPRPTPALTSAPLTEYQHRMQWKKQFASPSRVETASTRESTDNVKVSTIAVHEVYEQEELNQDWQEVYVTTAYLVWCPSNKKRRKKRRRPSQSSSASSSTNHSYKVIPRDVTEDLVPVSMETTKPCRPKSTKTPTGGQPFSPHILHKSPTQPNPNLTQFGMEDLSNLPTPVLSGMLKRINWRSNAATPAEEDKQEPNKISSPTKDIDNTTNLDQPNEPLDVDYTTLKEEGGSKMHLAVDINSRFTTPEEDEQMKEQKNEDDTETEEQTEESKQLALIQHLDDKLTEEKTGRELLPMHSIGVPIEDLPPPRLHHCTSSIPKRLSLGVALEPVNLVPVTPPPSSTPSEPGESSLEASVPVTKSGPLIVNVPSGRPESAPLPMSYEDKYYVNSAFRYTPSPVRAPAPTPISPDKYLEYIRYSRGSQSRRRSSSHDEDTSKSMRRWDTLSNVYDADEPVFNDAAVQYRATPVGKEIVPWDKKEQIPEGGIFLTEGIEPTDGGAWPTDRMIIGRSTPTCRSPSPGSKTCIPRDIMEQFQGDLYGKTNRPNQLDSCGKNKSVIIGGSIMSPGWRPPRSRTPIQFAQTPSRFPPRPLKQPSKDSIPKSLQIISIPKPQQLLRAKSTPPRGSSPNDDSIPLVLSESSLLNKSNDTAVSMEVHRSFSNVTDSGSIPPPPSPEAPVTLRNELHPLATLETLCEEDERSSRNTSIADILDKGLTSSRLSPLGDGSEMSEESVELPDGLGELNDSTENDAEPHHDKAENSEQTNPQLTQTSENIDSIQKSIPNNETLDRGKKVGTAELTGDKSAEDQKQKQDASISGEPPLLPNQSEDPTNSEIQETQDSQQPALGNTSETSHRGDAPKPDDPEGPSEPHRPGGSEEPHPSRGSPEPHPPRGSPKSHPSRDSSRDSPEPHPSRGSPEPHPPRGFPKSHPSRGSPEPHPPRGSPKSHPSRGSPEPHPPRGSPKSHPSRDSSRDSPEPHPSHDPPRGSPEPEPRPPQPPSPDVNSNKDFMDGLDMELDLAAELQAAMEGLDDFNLDDDDNDLDDDDDALDDDANDAHDLIDINDTKMTPADNVVPVED